MTLQTWRTIKLSERDRDAEALRSSIAAAGMAFVNPIKVEELLQSPAFDNSVQSTPTKLYQLVKVRPRELGLHEATNKDIVERGSALGLALCPPALAPCLRAQYSNQPEGEWLSVQMEPIIDAGGVPWKFCLVRNFQGAWLGAQNALAKTDLWQSTELLFARE